MQLSNVDGFAPLFLSSDVTALTVHSDVTLYTFRIRGYNQYMTVRDDYVMM